MDDMPRKILYFLAVLAGLYLLFRYVLPFVFKLLGWVIGAAFTIVMWVVIGFAVVVFISYIIQQLKK